MSSMFEVEHPGWGRVTVFAIRTLDDGSWEREWEPLRLAWRAELEALSDEERMAPRGTRGRLDALVDLVAVVDYHGWSDLRSNTARPLLDAGALSPERCLTKLDESLMLCAHRKSCPSWDERFCRADHARQPPCFDVALPHLPAPEPGGPSAVQTAANRLVELWRQGAWVCRYLSEAETLAML